MIISDNYFYKVGPRDDLYYGYSLVWLQREEKTSYAIKSNTRRGH